MAVDEWEALLDCDVNNMRHNLLTATLGYIICNQEGSDDTVARNVVMTATVHDIPEAPTGNDKTGDIPHGLVEKSDEAEEDEILRELGKDPIYPISSELAETAIKIMNDSKLPERKSREGELFRLTERLGYMRTAIIAHDAYKQLSEDSRELKERLICMWMDIFGNSYATLAGQYDQFNSVRGFFDDRLIQIEEMFQLGNLHSDTANAFYETRQVGGRKYDAIKEMGKISAASDAHDELAKRLGKK